MINSIRFPTFFFLALSLTACDKPLTPIGTECSVSEDCSLAGQSCVKNICTRSCLGDTGDDGCPVGFTCGPADAPGQFSCNKARYAIDKQGIPLLFGKSCATDANACNGTGDPNPTPLCRKAQVLYSDPPVAAAEDPRAYCTGACSTDADCPIQMSCGADFDGVRKCLERDLCAECALNQQCPHGGVCATSDGGKTRYCTNPCNGDTDCLGAAQTARYFHCAIVEDAAGLEVRACAHRAGACVGDGSLCAPCRADADCQSGACIYEYTTHERFCSQACATNADCGKGTCDEYKLICSAGVTEATSAPTCWP